LAVIVPTEIARGYTDGSRAAEGVLCVGGFGARVAPAAHIANARWYWLITVACENE